MATTEWFRNTTWNEDLENEFEIRLKRSRGPFHKAQYLRIQGGYLLEHPDWAVQLVGIRLMERLISDFPEEKFSTIFAHEQLGDYYLSSSNFTKAEKYFRVVVEHYEK